MSLPEDQRISMYTPQEIGNAIQKRRRALKISQKEFAKRLDKSERTIQKYESGEIAVKTEIIKQIANELDVPWQELLEDKKPELDELADKFPGPGYSFSTMADVIEALFAMTQIKDISFSLACTKPPESRDWTSSLLVDGRGKGMYDADFCLFMENWMNKLTALQSGTISEDEFKNWQNEMLKYYSKSYFSDAEPKKRNNRPWKFVKLKGGTNFVSINGDKNDTINE